MTLEEAYLMRKHECMSLQRENRKLTDTIDQLRKGTYMLFVKFCADRIVTINAEKNAA